ncbi:MAG: hypothetical protein A2Z17_03710 [Gammaproteobacteria bacterium RBG_16_66_13]|nr:MAG: hypothetical protein A2Z17_03710 [Gammaproteobacteria bacterium RBG_16_66_13]
MAQYQVSMDDNLKIVRVVVYGALSEPLGKEIITKSRLLAAEHAAGILYDMRQATLRVPFSSWFFLPTELEVLKTGSTRSIKAAIVIPAKQEDGYRFYETVASNAGLSVRVFLDEAEAGEWLSSSHHAPPHSGD